MGTTRSLLLTVATGLLLVSLGTVRPAAGTPGSAHAERTTSADAAAPSFRLFQMNMCMWGRDLSGPCFPEDTEEVAAKKRQAVVEQMEAREPDAATINEGCKGDMAKIVSQLRADGYQYTFKSVALGKGATDHYRPCSLDRGLEVNAVIAKSFSTYPGGNATDPYKKTHFFEKDGYRAWICTITQGVRVCAAHLSLPHQDWDGRKHQPIECNRLRAILRDRDGYPTIFAGDTNYRNYYPNTSSQYDAKKHLNKTNCMPRGFYGLQDVEYDTSTRDNHSGMQHIYYSNDFTRSSCGHMPEIPSTDHKGFWIDLVRTSSPSRGEACTWRDVRPSGWYPDMRWLHGYQFHQEAQSRWTAPAAIRLALTMQLKAQYPDHYPAQSTLATALGSPESPSMFTVRDVLNDQMAADGGPRAYATVGTPTTGGLRTDVRYDVICGYAVIARVKGHAIDTAGGGHYAEYGRYVDVVGYRDGGNVVTVEDVLKKGDDEHRRYTMTTAELAGWISGGYVA